MLGRGGGGESTGRGSGGGGTGRAVQLQVSRVTSPISLLVTFPLFSTFL